MALKLAGRRALVVGGSRGLGYAIALAFLRQGASVTITGTDFHKTAYPAYKALKAWDLADQWDVSYDGMYVQDRGNVELTFGQEKTLGRFPQIVVNCAGIYGPIGALEETNPADWAHAISVNLIGVANVLRAAIPEMKAQGYGKFIQLSGGGATKPMPHFSAYAASKAAVVRLCETVAMEVREHNIDINCIAPGLLDTRLNDEAKAAGHDFGEPVPMDRAVDLAVWLASADSDGITGKLISAQHDTWENPVTQLAMREDPESMTLRRVRGYPNA